MPVVVLERPSASFALAVAVLASLFEAAAKRATDFETITLTVALRPETTLKLALPNVTCLRFLPFLGFLGEGPDSLSVPVQRPGVAAGQETLTGASRLEDNRTA